ncbi:hypothetical protein [Streptomyces bauhiniae]|uniref:Uncharacterized protein n=1 Tax=Streptomyces bauhiniae TaxID=2340725 RepID=A0A7K3QZ76_9ACTN|nr:hypothetical protein [Streptomyces bauhiniae]NEB95209.1 hypothetical protein [Streptomyces bauhiniae]
MVESARTEIVQDASDGNPESGTCSELVPLTPKAPNAGLELKAMHTSFAVLSQLESEERTRAVRWLMDALGMNGHTPGTETAGSNLPPAGNAPVSGAAEETPSARVFMTQKKPASLVERIACLAYYLTVYRGTPHFKTSDLVLLNTEAAAPRFGNASRDADNADRQNGYLVSAGKGIKQLTPRGEAMVQALPDRGAVKAALEEHPYRQRKTRDTSPKRQAGSGTAGE